MKVITKHFGEVEVDEGRIIKFEQGILGFELDKEFVLFTEEENRSDGLCWLQSLTTPELALPVIDTIFWFPSYSPEVADEQVAKIGELEEKDLTVFSVVVITDKIEEMTTNLKAPILINNMTKKGLQVIAANDEYAIKHNLYEQMKFMKAGE